ncbi:MAG: hypothetical protein HFG85_15185 [Dorea sp.]|nr:hypothetical protein [Dorea sp.]
MYEELYDMEQNSNFIYAGDLSQELEEIEQLIPGEETVENQYTYTMKCGVVFTLKCC